jgi:hypothetical protein
MGFHIVRRRCSAPFLGGWFGNSFQHILRRLVFGTAEIGKGKQLKRSELTSESFGTLNSIHARRFVAAPIEAARFVERSLGGGQLVGSRPAGPFRLLSRRGPAADLALHVLRRSGASPCRLPHGSGRRMLLTGAARLRGWAAAPGGLVHCRRWRMLRPTRLRRGGRGRRTWVRRAHGCARRMLTSGGRGRTSRRRT